MHHSEIEVMLKEQISNAQLLLELNRLRQKVATLSKEKTHLEISLEAIAEHEDAFERQLLDVCNDQEQISKAQLLIEVNELRQQVTLLSKEKTHLEISLETIAEHGDVFENQLVEMHDILESEVAKRTYELKEKNKQLLNEIQERKRVEAALRESETYTRTLIKESPIGLALSQMDGNLIDINPAYANIIGYSVEEALKINFWKLIPYRGVYEKQLALLETTGRYGPFETEYVHKEGYLVPIRLSGLIVPHNDKPFIWTNATDITEQKKAETALRLAKESAEQAKTMAENANRAKSTFLANMSHELRTPLNAIIGYSDMLREEAQDMEYQEIISCLENIETAGKQLLNIISDILDITKIEAEKMDITLAEFEVNQLIKEVVTLTQPALEDNHLEIIITEDIGTMYADSTKVQQILQNLLHNAGKFTKQGIITLSVSRTPEWFTFKVADTGIGIEKEKLKDIFESFNQADNSTTRQYGGTGLGLTICQQFCQMMGGYIEVESQWCKGSLFIVQLPTSVENRQ
jgi:PAS domain S-box-containing protein